MDLNFRLDFKEQGNQALKEGNLELALTYYSNGIEQTSENHELYSNRSFVFYKLSKFEKSLQDAEKAITISPNWFKVLKNYFLIPKGLL
jgi:tetratricopeptide (TPR) repeat protein